MSIEPHVYDAEIVPEAVEPGTGRWMELGRKVTIANSDANWTTGDAALEIAPMSADGVNNGAMANLQEFCAEYDLVFNSVRLYRDVSDAWEPPNRLGGTSWTVHMALMAHPELIQEGMTVREARQAVKALPGGPEKEPKELPESSPTGDDGGRDGASGPSLPGTPEGDGPADDDGQPTDEPKPDETPETEPTPDGHGCTVTDPFSNMSAFLAQFLELWDLKPWTTESKSTRNKVKTRCKAILAIIEDMERNEE